MKKAIILLVAALGLAVAASAQPKALGVRLGYGGEISYEHGIGPHFLEADLGWYVGGFSLTGVFNFVFASAGPVNFYVGPGAQVGFYNYQGGAAVNVGAGGMLGLEWNIPSIPLQLSLDWRPMYHFLGEHAEFIYAGAGLGIRYRF